jgi:hypothetical protein
MKPLTIEHIIKNSKPHHTSSWRGGNSRQFTESIGDYLLSIVGGGVGLYGDFEENFEVALIDNTTGNFVTGKYSSRGDDVLGYATIEEINEVYFNIPRKSFS